MPTMDPSIFRAQREAFDVVRFVPAAHCEHFLEFTVKVQHFDTWMRAFEKEGAAQRGVRSADRLCFSPDATVVQAPPFEFFRWTGAGAAE